MRRWWLVETLGVVVLVAGGFYPAADFAAYAEVAPPPVLTGGAPGDPFLNDLPHPPFPSPGPQVPGWWSDLSHFIATVQEALDRLEQWIDAAQQAASVILTRIISESPGYLPQGTEVSELIGQIRLLPGELSRALQAVLAKLQVPVRVGSIEERHQGYIGSSPVLAHEARGIADTDQIVAAGAIQQTAASRVASMAASALAHDTQLPSAVANAQGVGRMLLGAARGLPSSRAGIELLVAGVGSGLEQQAILDAAVADRITVLAQQTAEVSQQIASLAATTGALAARGAEGDRRALDARLGLADAIARGAGVLEDLLAGAGAPSAEEMRLTPLY